MSDEYWDCQNCGKEIEAMGNDDFHFEVSERMNVGVPNPGATTVCGECWDKYGYREAYERQQLENRIQELEKEIVGRKNFENRRVQQVNNLIVRNKRFKQALEYYANQQNYTYGMLKPGVMLDGGRRAEKALAGKS